MSNQQLVGRGNTMMDETDQAIDRSKKVSCLNNDRIQIYF